jgi:hypothetical protein
MGACASTLVEPMRWPAKGGPNWSDRLTLPDIPAVEQAVAGPSCSKGRLVKMADRRDPEGRRGLCRSVARLDRCDRPAVSVQILRPRGGAAGAPLPPRGSDHATSFLPVRTGYRANVSTTSTISRLVSRTSAGNCKAPSTQISTVPLWWTSFVVLIPSGSRGGPAAPQG